MTEDIEQVARETLECKPRYIAVEPLDDTPVQYVGCYVLRWHEHGEPTIGFYKDETDVPALARAVLERGEVLRACEWSVRCDTEIVGMTLYRCPICDELQKNGHAPDCAMARTLKGE